MKVLIASQAEVDRLLPMGECVDLMAETLASLSRGEALNPLRSMMWLPEKSGVLASMPAHLADKRATGMKVINVTFSNEGTEWNPHQGAVVLFEPEHGTVAAIVDAGAITAIRTGAVSGVATRLLARQGAHVLAILGAGTQARSHLSAMLQVRPIDEVRVWSLPLETADVFAASMSQKHGLPVQAMATAQEAVRGADIICTTTPAEEPVLMGEWLEPGMHINAIGSSVPFARELDTAAVVRSRLYVDRRESTLNEAGDFLFPKREGAIGDDHIQGEIGEILLGAVAGRGSDDEITLFKGLGLAVEDVASAHYVYTKALQSGVGAWATLGGKRSEQS